MPTFKQRGRPFASWIELFRRAKQVSHSVNETLGFKIFLYSNFVNFTFDLNRFKKLADMYGRESDSDESEVSIKL